MKHKGPEHHLGCSPGDDTEQRNGEDSAPATADAADYDSSDSRPRRRRIGKHNVGAVRTSPAPDALPGNDSSSIHHFPRKAKLNVAFLQTFVMLSLAVLVQRLQPGDERPSVSTSAPRWLPVAKAAGATAEVDSSERSSRRSNGAAARSHASIQAADDLVADSVGSMRDGPALSRLDEDEDDLLPEAEHEEESGDGFSGRQTFSGVIIVATVDGSLAGLCRVTGRLLWIHSPENAAAQEGDRNDSAQATKEGGGSSSSTRRVLRPLVATTTTKQSTRAKMSSHGMDGRTTAVPSIDGSVYLTALAPHPPKDHESSSQQPHGHVQRQEVTVTTSVPELVARSPFVDARGRIYTGSRRSVSFAVDGASGDILHLVPGGGDGEGGASASPAASSDPDDRRNIVWLGRVDYSVSVHEARTGELDVQFASAHIMGVNDMLLSSKPATSSAASYATSGRYPFHTASGPQAVHSASSTAVNPRFTSSALLSSSADSLVATPNGKVAFRNQHGRISWVSDATFDTPVAFGVDSTSGSSLAVDIVPDAAVPDGTADYVSKEMERQMTIAQQQQGEVEDISERGGAAVNDFDVTSDVDDGDDQSIVGFLPSGDLFALPLGRRRRSSKPIRSASSVKSASSSILHHSHQATASSSSASAAATSVPRNHAKIPAWHSILPLHHQHHSSDEAPKNPRKPACHPGNPAFPECLVSEGGSHYVPAYLLKEPSSDDQVGRADHAGLVVKHQNGGDWYVPPHYYTILQPPDKRHRRYQKVLRILGSWLPPTIALLFVVSFELGRRKRQERHAGLIQSSHSSALTTVNANVDDETTTSALHVSTNADSAGVIQVMSDVILGYGGHGTVVYKGLLEGRQVAVKRMLRTYLASADREISLLIESDGHPNVVRYFLKEVRGDFVYLALELCDLSLHDLILKLKYRQDQREKENQSPGSVVSQATKNVLFQIASGVKHLHSLRIVHRDLKPMNILLADTRKASSRQSRDCEENILRVFDAENYVAKISDMGLGKQLVGQSSYGASLLGDGSLRGSANGAQSSIVGGGAGSVGWQAPEVMAMRTMPTDASVRSETSNGPESSLVYESVPDSSPLDVVSNSRTSRSVDIFSLGCIFYTTLLPGCHPFGEWYEREANIMHNRPATAALDEISPDASDLISSMIQRKQQDRPSAAHVCVHPLFWPLERRLSFICEFSDRIESDSVNADGMKCSGLSPLALAVEGNAAKVVGLAWDAQLDEKLVGNVQRFRTYDPSSVRDLLRLIRNKHHHFDELPDDLKSTMASSTDGLLRYFESRFPRLLIHCFNVCRALLPPDDLLVQKYSICPKRPLYESTVTLTAACPNADSGNRFNGRVDSANVPESKQLEQRVVHSIADGLITPRAEHSVEPIEAVLSTTAPENDAIIEARELQCPPTTPLAEANAFEGVVANNQDVSVAVSDDLVIWEGSTAARTFHCRGWSRSDDEWERRMDARLMIHRNKRDDSNLLRCAEDPKFRTRLCNYWDESLGTTCPMRKKGKCIFAHGPVELRVKEGKRHRWGKLVDKNGDNNNPCHSGGEDTYGVARSIEAERMQEGKWGTSKPCIQNSKGKKTGRKGRAS